MLAWSNSRTFVSSFCIVSTFDYGSPAGFPEKSNDWLFAFFEVYLFLLRLYMDLSFFWVLGAALMIFLRPAPAFGAAALMIFFWPVPAFEAAALMIFFWPVPIFYAPFCIGTLVFFDFSTTSWLSEHPMTRSIKFYLSCGSHKTGNIRVRSTLDMTDTSRSNLRNKHSQLTAIEMKPSYLLLQDLFSLNPNKYNST